MSETQRLFLALWPSEEQQQAWSELAGEWLPEGAGRLIKPANLHMTLLFLGDISVDQCASLKSKIDSYRGRAFELVMDRFGHWRRPQVAWLGASETPQELQDLVHALQLIARSCDIQVDTRPYRAHLTLARKVRKAPARIRFEPINWFVGDFVLVKSELTSEGALYEVVSKWSLNDSRGE
jgi:RNA 2',3'-cyclic 3'-phosphodiesterase